MLERDAVPRDAREGGCRALACPAGVEATMADVELTARAEETIGLGNVREGCSELDGGSSLSSAGREAQQPYRQKNRELVLFATRCKTTQYGASAKQRRAHQK